MFQSNLTISRTIYLELISRNYSNVVKYIIIYLYKSNNTLQYHINQDIAFSCIFRYKLDYVKYFMTSILSTRPCFCSILNEGAHGILFILTQNAYLYTPVFSLHCTFLYLSVFELRIINFYFPYSAMFYVVNFLVKVICWTSPGSASRAPYLIKS